MNKYLVTIGNGFQIKEDFIAYSKLSKEELEWKDDFLSSVDEKIYDMYFEYKDDDEEWEDFQSDVRLESIKEYQDDLDDCEIIYDERKL